MDGPATGPVHAGWATARLGRRPARTAPWTRAARTRSAPTGPRRAPGARSRLRALVRVAVLVLLAAGLYGLLPRLGGLAEQAAVLRTADPWLLAPAVAAELGAVVLYVAAFRRVLAEMGARRPFGTVLGAWLAAFFVSHLAVGGTAAGFVVDVEALHDADVERETTAEAISVLSLLMAGGIVVVLGLGLGLSAGTGLPAGTGPAVVVAVASVGAGTGLLLALARHPDDAEGLVLRLAGLPLLRRVPVPAARLGIAAHRLSLRARTLLSRRRIAVTMALVLGEIVLDAASLGLFLAAVGHVPPLGGLLVAYALATVVGTLPLTPSGLGLVEGALIALAVGSGVPAAAAIPAVLGYRLVNFWLPIPAGAVCYARLATARRRRERGGPSAPGSAPADPAQIGIRGRGR
ncbi:lysylphosphatidylglycerol synthase transmembrane domain-containing protein [uncultured Cellulomonas sp.]|uniref:lysylphosphatidylglycerol synthase transmembrane domain-containing protein n=1 Tax=uncultured Cellulomonas sp. TaxID=189682 RepID=UPI002612E7A1|nr:lysylphosphatidylglycerol synthase transmembrane domain-containing protein [uncultured Cellulomonas sp.]